jgi:hypothetical protein
MPVVRNNFNSGDICDEVRLNPMINPINIPPAALTISVPYGKCVPNILGAYKETM